MSKATFKDVAIKAAKEAGEIHQKYFRRTFKVKTKTTSFDLVTQADLDAERKVVSVVKKHFPEHNILAEENKYAKTSSAYTWIIDPLDGTNNFVCGLPIFCVSIALVKDNRTIVGVVYDVTRDELFCAQRNKGAYLNNKKISVSKTIHLKESLLITGFYYDRGRQMRENLDNIEKFFLKHIRGLRRLGAAALDLCYVGCGRASGFWEFLLNPWDFAAGELIVQEAGGKVSDKSGNVLFLKPSFVVASNGNIHNDILGVINRKRNKKKR